MSINKHIVPILLSFTFFSCTVVEKTEEHKPNIVFIFADDQCYDAINALGINDEVITPNLDRLVDRGVTFTNAYNMGAWQPAVCLASRAMLNTGRYVWDAQKFDNIESHERLAQEGQLWPQLMKKGGYKTYMTGKWHLNVKAEKVFDHVVHERPGMPDDAWSMELMNEIQKVYESGTDVSGMMANGYARPTSTKDTSWLPWDKSKGGYWEGGKHWSEVLGDDALNFLDQATKNDDPFFMYLAFNAPHDPRQSPKEFIDMYPLDSIAVPESFLPEYPYKDEIGCSPVLRDEGLAPFPRTEYSIKVNRQEYYALITHMDYQIGRILNELEASGKANNTYVFFTADHGLAVGNHGFTGKQNMYDHSIRPPLLVAGPNVIKGNKVYASVYIQDIMASCLEIAGVENPEYVRFNSLMPFLKGERENSFYPAIYGCYVNEQRMIRNDDLKLIIYPKAEVVRLYDMKNDPMELIDLAANKEYSDRINDLLLQFKGLQKEYNDTLDLSRMYQKYGAL